MIPHFRTLTRPLFQGPLWMLASVLAMGALGDAWAQQPAGSLEGAVRTGRGVPVLNANVALEGASWRTATADSGQFAFTGVPAGEYTLVVSCVGYQTVRRRVIVTPDGVQQVSVILTAQPVQAPEVVVTGTRSEKDAEGAPVRTDVISGKEIAAGGAVRLNDLLAEQTGLALVQDHGTGIQVQGFDSDYTLVLIDGEPVIGRTAGTLDLTRFCVANLRQVEVVKGPSSSLYGSEALAGVVNLITRAPEKPLGLSVRSRYGSHNALDLTGELELKKNALGLSMFVNRNSSSGYDLTPQTAPPTTPVYANYTLNPKLTYEAGERTQLSLSGKYFVENQRSLTETRLESGTVSLNDRERLLEWNVAPRAVFRWRPGLKLTGKLYATGYGTKSLLRFRNGGGVYSETVFRQRYYKAEAQFDATLRASHLLTAGSGYVVESVRADRIAGGRRRASSAFAYLQEEWIPWLWFEGIASARLDAHGDYATRLSPKVALLFTPIKGLRLRASVGSGFKAPEFRQLYLDFTNPTAGYSVFGSTGVREAIARLQREGQVQGILIDPASLTQIRPESSVSYNGGVEFDRWCPVSVGVNLFRNNVKDLIETAPVAIKNNGQNVFTYFNLNRVFTRGVEGELTIRPLRGVSLSVGYQYLEAMDEQALKNLREGKVVKIDSQTQKLRRVEVPEYGGLFNRSKQSGTVRVFYENTLLGLTGSLRGVIRGRYGYADRNLNVILDDPQEYLPGYALWNLTLSQRLFKKLRLQFGIDNLLDRTSPQFIPSLPGRTVYAGLTSEL